MLKFAGLLFLLVLSYSSQAYYEDVPEVIQLSESGNFSLEVGSQRCGGVEPDLLNGEESKICVSSVELPKSVKEEVTVMKAAELENESDYDQRITSIVALRWSGLEKGFSEEVLRKLSLALKINSFDIENVSFSDFVGNERSFDTFSDLFHGLEFKHYSQTQDFLIDTFSGKSVQSASFDEEVELYPGGGFNVSHFFFYAPSQGQLVYVKLSWWNS